MSVSNEKVLEIVPLIGKIAIEGVLRALKEHPDLCLNHTPHQLLILALKADEFACGVSATLKLVTDPVFADEVKKTIIDFDKRRAARN